ncbi:MAG: hypothetical protein ACRDYU_13605 [Actinomycetes bacterium]
MPPDWEVEGWVTPYAAGDLDLVTDAVERLSGSPPVNLATWLRHHPDSLDHLRG